MPKHPNRRQKHPDDIELPSLPNPIQPDYPIPLNISQSTIQAIQRRPYDIVHLHQPVLVDKLARTVAKRQGIPLVFTYHTRYEDYAKKYLSFLPEEIINVALENTVDQNIRRYDALLATTKTFRQWLKKKYRQPVYYVSTAGLTKPMRAKGSKQALRKKYRVPIKKTVLVNVSRQAPEKNLELLLKTHALLPDRYFLVMVGDGMAAKSLKELSRELGIQKRVLFTGALPQEKLAPYYTLADFFVYSSMTDTIGINILEAMSAGLPIIAVKDPNVEEVVTHQQNGLIVKPTEQAFAEAIQQFPEDKYNEFAEKAIKTAQQFLIPNTVRKLTETYQAVIKKHTQ